MSWSVISRPGSLSRGSGLAALVAIVLGCGPDVACFESHRAVGPIDADALLAIELGQELDPAELSFVPAAAVVRAEQTLTNRVVLHVASALAEPDLTIIHPRACPARVAVRRGMTTAIALAPLLEVGPPLAQVGFDAPFRFEVRPGCAEGRRGAISWRIASGAELIALTAEEHGFVVHGRTASLLASWVTTLPWGPVPFSPRTRAETVLEGRFAGSDGRDLVLTQRVAATTRASGLPTTGLGHRVVLGGEGWSIVESPEGARAPLEPLPGGATLVADVAGRWLLRDGMGAELSLRVGRHDRTPLDCGRGECHQRAAENAQSSPMTSVLMRRMATDGYRVACALGCHTAGEPGTDDGGYDQLATALGVGTVAATPGGIAALPRALRRVGGVTCTACHGPGAIPERDARWAILRSDVCATCHDAPPRYDKVVGWAASRMAHADARSGSRAAPCAGCHTTAGFLDRIAVRPLLEHGQPPPAAGDVGVACAACHAPHGEHVGDRLLRRLPEISAAAALAPDLIGQGSGVCLGCHSSPDGAWSGAENGQGLPEVTMGLLWLGRGGVRTADGMGVAGEAPHVGPKGCMGCHMTGRHNHDFSVASTSCDPCHDQDMAELQTVITSLEGRIQVLGARLVADRPAIDRPATDRFSLDRGAFRFHGSSPAELAPWSQAVSADGPWARALRDLLLITGDRSAAVHNPTYVRTLLDEIESMLGDSSATPAAER